MRTQTEGRDRAGPRRAVAALHVQFVRDLRGHCRKTSTTLWAP